MRTLRRDSGDDSPGSAHVQEENRMFASMGLNGTDAKAGDHGANALQLKHWTSRAASGIVRRLSRKKV